MNIEIKIADYRDPNQAKDISDLLNHYAMDPMGGGQPLGDFVLKNLAATLATVPNAFSVLCYIDGKPVGLINCFAGFSTFKCRPLLNIHDIVVHRNFRGLGVSQKMLNLVEKAARERNCCKLTLEVLEGNQVAKQAYIKYGFEGYELDADTGKALFWQKTL